MDEPLLVSGMTIVPGKNGSFIVRRINADFGRTSGEVWGFSDVDDLLAWFTCEAGEYAKTHTPELKEVSVFAAWQARGEAP